MAKAFSVVPATCKWPNSKESFRRAAALLGYTVTDKSSLSDVASCRPRDSLHHVNTIICRKTPFAKMKTPLMNSDR